MLKSSAAVNEPGGNVLGGTELETDPDELETDPDGLEPDPDELETDPDGLETDPDGLETDPDGLGSLFFFGSQGLTSFPISANLCI